MERFHPRHWPIWAWTVATLLAAFLRVDYSFGGFSLAPGVALLAGSFLGPRRGAGSQALAAVVIAPVTLLTAAFGETSGLGYDLGRIALAATAGAVAPAGVRLDRPRRRQLVVLGTLGSASFLYLWRGPEMAQHLNFVAVFGMAVIIGLYYAWRLVPEVGRMVAYLYSLLPYYAVALVWLWIAPHLSQRVAATVGGSTAAAIVFHGYLAHLPPDLLSAVLAGYLSVGGSERPLTGGTGSNREPASGDVENRSSGSAGRTPDRRPFDG